MNNEKIYAMAINRWGKEAQFLMVVEELSELLVASYRFNRGALSYDKLVDELADVEIMLEQLEYMLTTDGVDFHALVSNHWKDETTSHVNIRESLAYLIQTLMHYRRMKVGVDVVAQVVSIVYISLTKYRLEIILSADTDIYLDVANRKEVKLKMLATKLEMKQ